MHAKTDQEIVAILLISLNINTAMANPTRL